MPEVKLKVELHELKINGEVHELSGELKKTFVSPDIDTIEETFFEELESLMPHISREAFQMELVPLTLEHSDYFDSDCESLVRELGDLHELMDFLDDLKTTYKPNAYFAYVMENGYIGANELFGDKYMGKADSVEDFAHELASSLGDLNDVPSYISNHIDWEDVWENELSFDYEEICFESEYYFFRT